MRFEKGQCKLCGAPDAVREVIERRIVQGGGDYLNVQKWVERQQEFHGFTVSKSALWRHMRSHCQHRDARHVIMWPSGELTLYGEPISWLELTPQDLILTICYDEMSPKSKQNAEDYARRAEAESLEGSGEPSPVEKIEKSDGNSAR
jgi:hypothetical protein